MTYERKLDVPHAQAIPVGMALHAGEADSIRATIDQGVTAARDLIGEGVNTARGAIQKVPARAWRIGGMLAAAAVSMAVGAYAAFGRSGSSPKRKTPARRGNRRTPKSRARTKA